MCCYPVRPMSLSFDEKNFLRKRIGPILIFYFILFDIRDTFKNALHKFEILGRDISDMNIDA
jgi:hypothetical protein